MEFTPYTLPLIVAAAIALGLAVFVLRHRDVPGRLITFHDISKLAKAEREAAVPLPDLGRLHVLLADDNVVNQRMTSALLESRGHTVTIVGDGQEAIEALGGGSFDIVLMDIQMPNLDGVEATRLIRAGEQWTGKHLPIVAITAHAMKGDRERFLEAGMDAYLSKPVNVAVLFQTMARLLQGGDAGGPTSVADEPPGAAVESPRIADAEAIEGAVINRDVALHKVGGDEELLVEIIDLYLDDSPKVLEKLRVAVAGGDAEGIWKSAHRLKGSVGNLSAERAVAAASDLEKLGREGDLDAAAGAFAALEHEAEALVDALSELRAEVAG